MIASPLIRLATPADLPRINDIYNHYVLTSTCTYQEVPSTLEERQSWFTSRQSVHPVTVAEVDGKILGWASISEFRTRAAYRWTVENAVYVDHAAHGRGIGKALLADTIERASTLGHHSIMAVIDADQQRSLDLHRRFGFQQVAHLREAGRKFDRWLDVIYLQRLLT